jgi:D-glycero-D-manno-heptose 1,7-bisphosphate phosphatase
LNDIEITPCLFLDRDGVINVDRGYVSNASDFEFIEGIFPLSRYFKRLGYKIVVVTNQSGVGRGYFSKEAFDDLTSWMGKRFVEEKCSIDLILAATADPTNPDASEIELFRRKPNPGMILEAPKALNLDLSRSLLIGDNLRDVEAGMAAGIPNLYLIGEHPTDPSKAECFADLNQCLIVLKKKFGEVS